MPDEDFIAKVYRKGDDLGLGTLSKLVEVMSGESRLYAKNTYASHAYCPRRVIFENKISPDQKIPMNATSEFFFKGGTTFHEIIQSAFSKAGLLYGAEVRIEYLGVAGFIDVVFEDEDGVTALLDIKTCGSRIPSWPKLEYVRQIQTYGLLTGIDRLYILYMSRSVMNYKMELAWKMIKIPFTPQDKRDVAVRLAWGIVGKKYNIIPNIPSEIASEKDCGWCSFVGQCWPMVESPPVTKFDWGKEGKPDPDWVDEDGKILAEVKETAKKFMKYGKTYGNKKILKLVEGE